MQPPAPAERPSPIAPSVAAVAAIRAPAPAAKPSAAPAASNSPAPLDARRVWATVLEAVSHKPTRAPMFAKVRLAELSAPPGAAASDTGPVGAVIEGPAPAVTATVIKFVAEEIGKVVGRPVAVTARQIDEPVDDAATPANPRSAAAGLARPAAAGVLLPHPLSAPGGPSVGAGGIAGPSGTAAANAGSAPEAAEHPLVKLAADVFNARVVATFKEP